MQRGLEFCGVMEQFHILKCDVGYTMCASFKTQNHILKRAVVFYVKLYFSKLDFKKERC